MVGSRIGNLSHFPPLWTVPLPAINNVAKFLAHIFTNLLPPQKLVVHHSFEIMLALDTPPSSSPSSTLGTTNRILVVEDEELIREMLVLGLEEQGYDVVAVADGQTALSWCQGQLLKQQPFPFDLIVLDVMLPKVNGLDLCRFLRYQGNHVPILIVSAKTDETDRVLGLEVGADDYITKPFSMRELVARCRALLRRHRLHFISTSQMLQFQDIALYPAECRVLVRGTAVNLSPKEFRLLELFMENPRRVWSREKLLDRIWGEDFIGDPKTVDVHIRWLREKLEIDPSQPQYIVTVRGFGYRFG